MKCCCTRQEVINVLKKPENIVIFCTILAVILAVAVAIPVRSLSLDSKTLYSISMPGVILMNLLKMMIVPLLVTSILTGLTSINLRTSGKMGGLTVAYYVFTTFIACLLGLGLVMAIRPGRVNLKSLDHMMEKQTRVVDPSESVLNIFNNLFSDNIVRSTFMQTELKFEVTANNATVKKVRYVYATNFLGMIFFSIFFGAVISSMGDTAKPLIELINILNIATLQMIKIILIYMPIGIFFLILYNLLSIQNIESAFLGLGLFAVTIVTGLAIHLLIVLPLLFFICTRRNPYKFMWGMSKAMLVAFVTQSSSATLPVTTLCAEQNNNIDPRVTRFMLPIGAIINMDGTGLYEAVAAIFIAQVNNIELSFGDLIKISVTSTLAAIGAATVPSAGLVTLLIVLTTAGLPTHQVTLLYSIDWILDRIRTAVNIMGDAFGCGIIQRFCGKDLEIINKEQDITMF